MEIEIPNERSILLTTERRGKYDSERFGRLLITPHATLQKAGFKPTSYFSREVRGYIALLELEKDDLEGPRVFSVHQNRYPFIETEEARKTLFRKPLTYFLKMQYYAISHSFGPFKLERRVDYPDDIFKEDILWALDNYESREQIGIPQGFNGNRVNMKRHFGSKALLKALNGLSYLPEHANWEIEQIELNRKAN